VITLSCVASGVVAYVSAQMAEVLISVALMALLAIGAVVLVVTSLSFDP